MAKCPKSGSRPRNSGSCLRIPGFCGKLYKNDLGKVRKFQHAGTNTFRVMLKKLQGGSICPPPPVRIGLKRDLKAKIGPKSPRFTGLIYLFQEEDNSNPLSNLLRRPKIGIWDSKGRSWRRSGKGSSSRRRTSGTVCNITPEFYRM